MHADLVLATDPDADRLGGHGAGPGAATFSFVTGNEIAALLTHFKLAKLAERRHDAGRSRSSSRRW